MDVYLVPCLSDNYGFVVRDPSSGVTALVDTPEFDPIDSFLIEKDWSPDIVLNTHHHPDHVGFNLSFKEKYNCKIVGPIYDHRRIPGIDEKVKEGDKVKVGNLEAEVLFVPGHTKGLVNYYFEEQGTLFTADLLFSIGCGYIFEGTAEQMWESLKKVRDLPETTIVYCAHEYTLKNIEFAQTIDPDNLDLKTYAEIVKALRAQDQPTVPTTIRTEIKANPFMRADKEPIVSKYGAGDPVTAFATIREMKNKF